MATCVSESPLGMQSAKSSLASPAESHVTSVWDATVWNSPLYMNLLSPLSKKCHRLPVLDFDESLTEEESLVTVSSLDSDVNITSFLDSDTDLDNATLTKASSAMSGRVFNLLENHPRQAKDTRSRSRQTQDHLSTYTSSDTSSQSTDTQQCHLTNDADITSRLTPTTRRALSKKLKKFGRQFHSVGSRRQLQTLAVI